MCSKQATEPIFESSSMIQASNVTRPSLSGRPPYPTLRSLGSPSGIFTPASTASKARPFLLKISHAAALACSPKFQVESTIGLVLFMGAVIFSPRDSLLNA